MTLQKVVETVLRQMRAMKVKESQRNFKRQILFDVILFYFLYFGLSILEGAH